MWSEAENQLAILSNPRTKEFRPFPAVILEEIRNRKLWLLLCLQGHEESVFDPPKSKWSLSVVPPAETRRGT
jgi:hypothetical protein